MDIELVGTESDGLALQQRLVRLCQDWLAPALEEALDHLVPVDEHWIIDRLEVDAGSIALDTFERDLIETMMQATEQQLKERAAPWSAQGSPRELLQLGSLGSSGLIQRRTDAHSVHEAFLHFLKTGILPWWFHLPAGKTLEDVVLASWQKVGQPAYFGRTLMEAMASVGVRTRLVRQFSTDFLSALLAGLSAGGEPAMREILAEIKKYDVTPEMFGGLSQQLWQAAFTTLASGRPLTVQNVAAEWINELSVGEGQPQSRLIERIAQLWLPTQSRGTRVEERIPPKSGSAAAEADEPGFPQFSADFLSALLAGLPAGGEPAMREILAEIKKYDVTPEMFGGLSQQLWQAAITTLASGRSLEAQNEPASHIDLEEGVYVECAGLVLLHPFLPRLFEALHITKDDKLVQTDRALCLLHFLATGKPRALEYELLVPKALCNLPLAAPVEAPVALTAAEEEEAIALLEATIRHWDAIGDTSVSGLREAFLARPGKFSRRGNGDDVLQVESRSFDILLDRLPWGIGMIQLPWMEKMLWVEWSS